MAIELVIGVILIIAAIVLFLHLVKGAAVTALAVCVLIAGLFLIFGGIPGMPGVSRFIGDKIGAISGSAVHGGEGLEVTNVNQTDEVISITVTNIGAESLEDFEIYANNESVNWIDEPKIPLDPGESTVFSIEGENIQEIKIKADDVEVQAQLK